MKLHNANEIQEMIKVSKIELSKWVSIGAIKPVVDNSRCGGIRMFDLKNLIDINLCKKLNELRLSVHVMASCLKQLHRCGRSKNMDRNKSFWDHYLRTYETKQWFLVIINKQNSAITGKIDNIFLQAYKRIGVVLPNDVKDIFLVFPVPKEKLLSVFEFADLTIVLKLDEIVDMVVDKFCSKELIYDQGII